MLLARASSSGLLYVVIWFFLDWNNGCGWVVSVEASGDLAIGWSVGYLLATTPDDLGGYILRLATGCAKGTACHLFTRLAVRERRPERRRSATEAALLLTRILGQLVVGLSVNGDWHSAYPVSITRE